jgi:hypothetical protein
MAINTHQVDNAIPQVSISAGIKLLQLVANRISSSYKQGIFLWGPPGIGKSDLVRELAKITKREFVDIRLSTIDPVDLRGLPKINAMETLTQWLPPDFLPQKDANPGILFLDEINAAPPSVQAAAYQLILDRKLGNYTVPDNWMLISAGNRLGDRSVSFRLPSALANRFTHLDIIVEPVEWYKWAWENDIDPYIISFLHYQPGLLNRFDPERQELAFPTPRSWAFVSAFQDVRSVDISLYYKAVQGTVGEAAAQQFLAFLKYKDQLADPEDILEGRTYTEPTQPDAQYVMMAALIHAIRINFTADRVKNFFSYVHRYQKTAFTDYSVILVKELVNAIESMNTSDDNKKILLEHPSFKLWVNDNLDVLS